ncbi:ABC transporter ATP-binding protein [uncultured Hoeflea sp.]|uniref:ABC transporter ATP-binding protein n=1 Tax=uncultured Hoeflea sp. TaxID=538666 RepID=UPI0030EC7403|tara:strand:- start:191635 stop:192663 length:1029 start_codon:yes stop_codon:yes gene_type:complete
METLLSVKDLKIDFDQGKRFVRALHGVNLDVAKGEVLGVVGESGCGKSITWLAALGLLGNRARISGSVRLDGEEIAGMNETDLSRLRGGRIAMIFQDPSSSLNPVHRIGRQINEALKLHRGLTGAAADAESARLLDRVGIANATRRLREYPHEMSGGMNQRIMIAMALAGEPELLIADEPTTALDATIQAQILDLLTELRRDTGMALVLISHDLGVVADMSDRVAVMYGGRVIEEADTGSLFDNPAHPYTKGLIAALPDIDGPRRRLESIPGTVPAPDQLPPGCSFAPRCAIASKICDAAMPGFLPFGESANHFAACVKCREEDRFGETAPGEAVKPGLVPA